jgi:hypothetical protein
VDGFTVATSNLIGAEDSCALASFTAPYSEIAKAHNNPQAQEKQLRARFMSIFLPMGYE